MKRLAALALSLTCTDVASEAVRKAFAGLPSRRFVYRDIPGDTVEAISAALEASADRPPWGGSSYANTRWDIDWRWQSSGDGPACRIRTASVSFAAVITLPRLADPAALDPELRARWDRFQTAIEAHEARHARMAWATLPAVRRAVLASSCRGAGRAGRAVTRALEREQQAYDDRTRYGAAEGAHFP